MLAIATVARLSRQLPIWALALSALACSPISDAAHATSLSASPANLEYAISAAKAGDTVVLSPGDYGIVTIANRQWANPINLDARAATFTGIVLRNVDGLSITGGAIHGVGGRTYGVLASLSRHIDLTDLSISGGVRAGVVIDRTDDVAIRGLEISDTSSDGIDIGLSHRILIDHLNCHDFHPTPSTFDAEGHKLTEGAHPDCVQAWSRPTAPPVSDVTVTNVSAVGEMQGISFFNHIRDGVDDGGFDRITITHNVVHNSYPEGIALNTGRHSVIRDNNVSAIPGSVLAKNGYPVKSSINVVNGADNVVCGNIVPNVPRSPAAAPC
jgi:hypothetical protein